MKKNILLVQKNEGRIIRKIQQGWVQKIEKKT